MIREPYSRYNFTNLVAMPLTILAIMAGFNSIADKTAEQSALMVKLCLGSLATLAIAVWIRHLGRRQKIEAHKRVLRLSRQSGVCDEMIAGTQGWSDKHLAQLQREMDKEDREGTHEARGEFEG